MSTRTKTAPTSAREWRQEYIPLDKIVKHQPFQVRRKLDSRAIRLYRTQHDAGQTPPPIKVARVAGQYYLLDGWHRMAAGALEVSTDEFGTGTDEVQFANSPDLAKEIMSAVMDALTAHTAMSKQALESEALRSDLKDVLLGAGQLWEGLRDKGNNAGVHGAL